MELLFTASTLVFAGAAEPLQPDYHAAILVDGINFCSGAVISERFVLTAAQCLMGCRQADVVAGHPELLSPDATAIVSDEFVFHPGAPALDLALVRLPRPLPLGERVRAVGLTPPANASAAAEVGRKARLTGWTLSGRVGAHLATVEGQVVNRSRCETPLRNKVGELVGCLDSRLNTGSFGEVGSPLVADDRTLLGFVSFKAGAYAIFTRAAPHLRWIRDTAGIN